MPLEWIDYKEAARLYHQGQVAYACGSPLYVLHGGTNARPGHARRWRSVRSLPRLATPPTRATRGMTMFRRSTTRRCSGATATCACTARALFLSDLSRDHIRPFSQGGQDTWSNVATACRRCNNAKASRTPEQAKMQLIAVPFTPTYAEYIFLKGRRVLADQMQYLLAHFPRSSPLHERIRSWAN